MVRASDIGGVETEEVVMVEVRAEMEFSDGRKVGLQSV